MNILFFSPLLISQISAGPSPETLAEHLRISGVSGRVMATLPHVEYFPITRYLRLAEYLQSIPERERITWLRMAARSTALDEPGVILAQMLIRARNGKQLRQDSLIEIYRAVPFFISESGSLTAMQMHGDAATYVEYLLANGEWCETKFKVLSNEQVTEIANDYLAQRARKGLSVSRQMRESILNQASVALRPETKIP